MNVSPLLRELMLHVSKRTSIDPRLDSESHAVALLLDQLLSIEVVGRTAGASPRTLRVCAAERDRAHSNEYLAQAC